ncbi:MAG TPA: SpoIIE family protein phosphatase [Micromonosporaceae bacterium]|nr:SpoIIE family protein phosphatase [Micromonosporaceae bacterium]
MPADLAAAVRLGGQMGRRFAEFDWASHPLGEPATWPPEVRASVAVALTSRFPIVLWLGADDLYLVYNDAYLPVLGDKHPAALGTPGKQVWWDIWSHIGPMLAGVVSTGEATWSNDLMLPVVTDGKARERFFTFSYGPLVLANGRIDGVFCAVNETTERVLGERRLHVLNSVAGAVMEARTVDDAVTAMIEVCGEGHPDLPFMAVYLAGPRGSTLRAASPSVAGLLPRHLAEIVGADGDDTVPGSLFDLRPLIPASTRGESRPRQALVLPLSGGGTEVSMGGLVVGLNPLRPVDDLYRGFCRLLADQMTAALATAASYQQQQLRADTLAELDRAKTTFLTNVSHEFRTPLTLLIGPLQDAIDAAGNDPAQQERLAIARRNARRLLRLVNSLLEFSRIEAGRVELNLRPVSLGAITAQVASSFAGLCERAGIGLVLDCAPVTGAVDVDMWETIVLNLLSNAAKFTYAGSITVELRPLADGASRLRVADTGTGIAAHDLDRLFERFYRADNSRGRTVEGSGIGLSLVRSLVELHGGTIGVESELDRGTTVTVELPPPAGGDERAPLDRLTDADDPADNAFVAEALQWLDRPDPAAGPGAVPADRALVLIADDNADMRAHLDRILSERWDTITTADGRAALEAMRRDRPDLLVTDVMMPGLDGFALTRAIRSDPAIAGTPVLMLSARAGSEAAGAGLASGADDYLAKPFTSTDLVNRVEARLRAAARELAHRARDEATVRREAAIADMTAAISAAESIHQLLSAVRSGPLDTSAAAVAVVDEDRQYATVYFDGAVDPEVSARYHRVSLDAPVPIANAITTEQPMVMPNPQLIDPRFEQVVRDVATSIQARAIYPLHDTAGTVIGALALLWPKPTSFTRSQLDLFAHAAVVTGPALARLKIIAEEHRIATDFQKHLLDLDRSCAEVAVAALYQSATDVMQVGGDWYLATPAQPGRIAVSVGDVVGHGLAAATVMGNLRAVVAASALAAADPRHVLTYVQRYAGTLDGARCSTLAYVTLDTATGTLNYICAGHPYPLLVTADGATRLLRDGRMPPLAAFGQLHDQTPGQAVLPPGSMLILYTDGLIERRGESLNDGLARLEAAAADCATMASDAACASLLRRLAPPGGYTDDVVILALRPTGTTPTSWVTTSPAVRTQLPELRHRLHAWLSGLGLDTALHHNILISVGEAVANALEHGSDFDPGKTVTVEAFATPEGIAVSVRDAGQWSGDSTASHRKFDRGRGLTLMHGLADQVDTTRTAQGTTVTLHYPSRPGTTIATPGALP